jgi:hypothetical protein
VHKSPGPTAIVGVERVDVVGGFFKEVDIVGNLRHKVEPVEPLVPTHRHALDMQIGGIVLEALALFDLGVVPEIKGIFDRHLIPIPRIAVHLRHAVVGKLIDLVDGSLGRVGCCAYDADEKYCTKNTYRSFLHLSHLLYTGNLRQKGHASRQV